MEALKPFEVNLLKTIADLDGTPSGAYNIRANGLLAGRSTTETVDIVTKQDKPGLDVYVKAGTKGETLHIPVLISQSGLSDTVYNDFHIGEGCDITILAGCGIHNDGDKMSRHDGLHSFFVGQNAKVRYVERHYGENAAGRTGDNVMNPTTLLVLEEGSHMEMETTQIRGVTSTKRVTIAKLGADASLVIRENLMTDGQQTATTEFTVDLDGAGSSANVVSRSVARGKSHQVFLSRINGNNTCAGHTECDAIIMDEASVRAVPEITANSPDASLIHEAAIGKIAGEQLIKLMTLGLTEAEAEEQIVNGFLK